MSKRVKVGELQVGDVVEVRDRPWSDRTPWSRLPAHRVTVATVTAPWDGLQLGLASDDARHGGYEWGVYWYAAGGRLAVGSGAHEVRVRLVEWAASRSLSAADLVTVGRVVVKDRYQCGECGRSVSVEDIVFGHDCEVGL